MNSVFDWLRMASPSDCEPLSAEIDVGDVNRLIDESVKLLLLDCREAFEIEFCRIEPSLWIPMDQTPSRLDELEPYREARLVVYCHLGTRSHFVVQWLRANGFPAAQNMTGGIDAWSQSIDSTIARY